MATSSREFERHVNYRSPILSLQHELETLEAELAALRALPPAQPRPAPTPSKKRRSAAERETRVLRDTLKRLKKRQLPKKRTDARSEALEVRELTPREIASGRSMNRVALGFVTAGALVLTVHLVVATFTRMVWVETSCTRVTNEDGAYEASYTMDKAEHTFFIGKKDVPAHMPCWVASPPLTNLGELTRPPRPNVPLWHKLSFGWIFTAIIGVALGLMFYLINLADEQKRRNRQIEEDVFESAD